MFKLTNIVLVGLAIGAACLSYAVKYDTQAKSDRLDVLNKLMGDELESIRVANVEWNYLTRPERLKKLAGMRTDLKTMSLSQIVTADELAARVPLNVEAELDEAATYSKKYGLALPRMKPSALNQGE